MGNFIQFVNSKNKEESVGLPNSVKENQLFKRNEEGKIRNKK